MPEPLAYGGYRPDDPVSAAASGPKPSVLPAVALGGMLGVGGGSVFGYGVGWVASAASGTFGFEIILAAIGGFFGLIIGAVIGAIVGTPYGSGGRHPE